MRRHAVVPETPLTCDLLGAMRAAVAIEIMGSHERAVALAHFVVERGVLPCLMDGVAAGDPRATGVLAALREAAPVVIDAAIAAEASKAIAATVEATVKDTRTEPAARAVDVREGPVEVPQVAPAPAEAAPTTAPPTAQRMAASSRRRTVPRAARTWFS